MKRSWSYLCSLVKLLAPPKEMPRFGAAISGTTDAQLKRIPCRYMQVHYGAGFACWKALFYHQLSVHAWSEYCGFATASHRSFLFIAILSIFTFWVAQGNSRNRPALQVAEAFLLASPAVCWRRTSAGTVTECNKILSRIAANLKNRQIYGNMATDRIMGNKNVQLRQAVPASDFSIIRFFPV